MSKLLKTRIRGGMLIVTERELVLGEGWLGTQNVRRFPIQHIVGVDLQSSPREQLLNRSVLLRLLSDDGNVTEVDGIGRIAAQRVRDLLMVLSKIDIQ